MSFSKYLDSKRSEMKQLIAELKKNYQYVSVLGVDIKSTDISVDVNTSNIDPGADVECGFVIKMSNGREFYEYSLDDISGDIPALEKNIAESLAVEESLKTNTIDEVILTDEPLVKSFVREGDFDKYTDKELLEFCKSTCKQLKDKSEYVLNAVVRLSKLEVSKLFISEHRVLDQNYTWTNGMMIVVYRENGKTIQAYESEGDPTLAVIYNNLPEKMDKLLEKAHMLTLAKPIEPGVYDVITAPSITGLIAHEACGHGVEMDQVVTDRALAKRYVGE